MLTSEQQRAYVGHCGACRATVRPNFIPWEQHSIGCPVRAAVLLTRSSAFLRDLERIRALDVVSPGRKS